MIKKANELDFSSKKLDVIIAGVPGVGKTTLALSAPKPLLIDLDNGVSRVEAKWRMDTDVAKTFEELKSDLANTDLSPYETLVIDTGGKLLEMLKPVVIAEDAKNAKRNGVLSLQGYGAVKRAYKQFKDYLKSLDKNIITIFHASEVNLENDLTGLRIRIEGSTKDDVWDDVDLGGFVEIIGKKRTISFNNCERYYAKGTHGVHGVYEIPDLNNSKSNDFLTQLFNKIKDDLKNESESFAKYQELMNKYDFEKLEKKNVNKVLLSISKEEHILTSKEELWNKLQSKANELGMVYDKSSKQFIDNTDTAK